MHYATPILSFLLLTACGVQDQAVNVVGETSRRSPVPPGELVKPSQTNPYRGEVLFMEPFDDNRLTSRDWYDVDQPRISTSEHAPASRASFECHYAQGATECTGGIPGRRLFEPLEEMFFSYWVKYDANWVGSGKLYHPHEFLFMTTEEDRWAGPSYTRLTVYMEQVASRPRVMVQDGMNVDPACVLRNDDSVVGCAGHTLATYPFGEAKSVASCNGLVGPVDGRDCYSLGGDRWSSVRWWGSPDALLAGGSGWHHVETYVRLNSVVDGKGVADGEIRQWVDGQATVVAEGLLLRTGRHPTMRLNQLLVAPYIGDGSPIAQTAWFDELIVARGKRP